MPGDAARERRARDRFAVATLVEEHGQVGEEGRDGNERRQHDREPRPQAHEQPDGLRADEEDPEVVRGEREGADDGPPRQPATVAAESEPEA